MQRRLIRDLHRETHRYVANHAYRDFQVAETICVSSPNEVSYHLTVTYPEFFEELTTAEITDTSQHFTKHVEKGLVLVDSRGRGSFQR